VGPKRVVLVVVACAVIVAGVLVGGRTPSRTGAARPVGPHVQGSGERLATTGSGAPGVSAPISGSAPAHLVRVRPREQDTPHAPAFGTRELTLEQQGEEGDAASVKGIEPEAGPITPTAVDAAQQPHGSLPDVTLGTGFQGIQYRDNGGPNSWSIPPDTNGAIGNGWYLQMVNSVFAIWDVSDPANPTMLAGYPTKISSVFSAPGMGMCATHDDGDPVVVYDAAADRFVISQFALNLRQEKYAECIAVSQSGDLGAATWWAYRFDYPKPLLPDYPKLGVWPDAYYASFNQFDVSNGFSWGGAGAIAYERSAMLTGAPAQWIYFDLYGVRPDLGGMLPSNWNGTTTPPVGAPNVYDMFDADERGWGYRDDQVELWAFHADFTTPGDSTFAKVQRPIAVANFNPWICGAFKVYCVPQKNSDRKLDTLLTESMFPLQYRNDGTTQHLVFTHSVHANGGGSGIRWYDLVRPSDDSANWSVGDQGTYAPDSKYRWMGSAAINGAGDVAIGFSTSSGHIFPKIGVAGRIPATPAGTMSADSTVYAGAGSERGKYGRWGDYSAMTVDPRDDCTFWYTNQYYKRTSQWAWGTWIQPFTIPGTSC